MYAVPAQVYSHDRLRGCVGPPPLTLLWQSPEYVAWVRTPGTGFHPAAARDAGSAPSHNAVQNSASAPVTTDASSRTPNRQPPASLASPSGLTRRVPPCGGGDSAKGAWGIPTAYESGRGSLARVTGGHDPELQRPRRRHRHTFGCSARADAAVQGHFKIRARHHAKRRRKPKFLVFSQSCTGNAE